GAVPAGGGCAPRARARGDPDLRDRLRRRRFLGARPGRDDPVGGAPARRAGSLVLARGLELIRSGEFFAAHEELEDAWRAADPAEKDFFQGLVHVAVAWYQAGRGNRVGCERQLEKAARRLGPFTPEHRGVDVASVL